MQDVVRIIATAVVGLGLAMILWRELVGAKERRKVGAVQDVIEVMLPVAATIALVVWVWV